MTFDFEGAFGKRSTSRMPEIECRFSLFHLRALKERLEMVAYKNPVHFSSPVLQLTLFPSDNDVLFFRADVPLPGRPRGQDRLAGLADRVPVEIRVTHEVL